MRVDVAALKSFYESQLGEVAARQIAREVAELWPRLAGETVVGVGYAPPVLDAILADAAPDRAIALMPAAQGAVAWPSPAAVATAMMRERQIPLADRSADRIVLLHALEDAGEVEPFLREVWRVLSDSGRLLAIAANRRGLWCRADAAPFGHGRPYSASQLRRTLTAAMFTVEQEAHALYLPPTRRALSLWSADAAERFGRRWLGGFGGVVMIDATKNMYGAAPTAGARRMVGRLAEAGAGPSNGKSRGRGRVR